MKSMMCNKVMDHVLNAQKKIYNLKIQTIR